MELGLLRRKKIPKTVYVAFKFYITTYSYLLSNDFIVCMQYIHFFLNILYAFKSGDRYVSNCDRFAP